MHIKGSNPVPSTALPPYHLPFTHRNKDFQEVTLEKDGVVVLRFASTYGFRNIQNLVQKLKRGKSPYHFVEVMACPSGKERRGIQKDNRSFYSILKPTFMVIVQINRNAILIKKVHEKK